MNVAAPSGDLNVATKSDVDIFDGEAGVVKALTTLRQAPISPAEKDSLRNLFLSYAGESDDTKRAIIKSQIIEQVGKHPELSSLIKGTNKVAVTAETKPEGNLNTSIGQTRPTPSFVASAPTRTEPTPIAAPSPAPKVVVATPPVVPPQAPPPPPTPETVPEPTPAPIAPPVAAPVKKEPEPAMSAPVATDVRARIDAIKHDVNGRVGNPVNVINADEAIGREYMSALLDAMKRSSTGGGAESLPRLEAAYKATIDLIEQKGLGNKPSTPTAAATPAAPAPEVRAEPTVVPEPAPTPVAPQPQAVEVEPTPAPLPPPPPTPQSEGLYHRPSDEIEEETNPEKPKSSFASKFFKSQLPPKLDTELKPTVEAAPTTSVRKVEVNNEVTPREAGAAAPLTSDKLKPLKDASVTLPEKMAAIKSASAKREEEAKKPITDLKSPEVEAGLRQLLSEWVLFKKSGFLGTGPSGIDHPLYKQLAAMPMASVVSGRFEGVTPDIKRHLSDYMTGWRYEQGVMHEMGETFENYLRRVIRQVLEAQRIKLNKES